MTLEKLVHDVYSKCSSLRDAAKLLADAEPAERRELFALMVRQARALAEELAAFEKKR